MIAITPTALHLHKMIHVAATMNTLPVSHTPIDPIWHRLDHAISALKYG
jgi:hypothetical protein